METKDNILQVIAGLENIILKFQQQDPYKQFINQKRLDENFHKYKLVKRIVNLIKECLSNQVDDIVTQECINQIISNQLSETDIASELSKTSEFQNVLEKILAEIEDVVLHVDDLDIERTSTPKDTSSILGWDSIVERNANLFDDSLVITSEQRKKISLDLDPSNELETRRKAILMLEEISPVDIVPNEHWDLVIKALSTALGDVDQMFVETITNCN